MPLMRKTLLPKVLLAFGMLAMPAMTLAASTPFSIESADVGLGGADLKTTTINIIKLVLGLLTLVAVTMIIASVFIAATSGDSDRADKAKRTIAGAVIGLIIVLLAWAIVLFVTRTTANVTANS